MYGDNHTLLNKWFKRTGKRSEIFLATKSAYITDDGFRIDSSGEYMKKACYKNLEDLGLDYVDLCKFPVQAAMLVAGVAGKSNKLILQNTKQSTPTAQTLTYLSRIP